MNDHGAQKVWDSLTDRQREELFRSMFVFMDITYPVELTIIACALIGE